MKFYSNIYQPNKKNLTKASKLIKSGKVIAIPTETVYGLAGNAYRNDSVKKIYSLKKRPKNNPLIVHFSSVKTMNQEVVINEQLIKLAKKFSPGPLTYILPLKKESRISKLVLNKKHQIACRIPNNKTFLAVLKQSGVPIAAPSANLSNKLSTTRSADVEKEFGKKLSYILDSKKTSIGLESTVLLLGASLKILRPGAITKEMIFKVLREKIHEVKNQGDIISPGQFKKHYSPGIPVYLNQKKPKPNGALLVFGGKKIKKDIFFLSKRSSLKEAASNLYVLLRKIKELGYKSISITNIPNTGIGKAINDRIRRASS
ncbi:L-threonylcarbamoyladenylate synthase [Pelagibacteraceae bacterium]|nr:L-threonylcarbamoyladenylate synthase [Pelagibacteraceae bacterium]